VLHTYIYMTLVA